MLQFFIEYVILSPIFFAFWSVKDPAAGKAFAVAFLAWFISLVCGGFQVLVSGKISIFAIFLFIGITLSWVQFYMPIDKDVLDYVLPHFLKAHRDYGFGADGIP